MIFQGDFGLTEKPEVQKMYSVQEIAEKFHVTCNTIRNLSNRMNLPHDFMITDRARIAVYPYESIKVLQEYFDKREKKRKLAEQLKIRAMVNDETPEDIESHPLVKDKRCLKLSWWPDIVPVCFEEENTSANL